MNQGMVLEKCQNQKLHRFESAIVKAFCEASANDIHLPGLPFKMSASCSRCCCCFLACLTQHTVARLTRLLKQAPVVEKRPSPERKVAERSPFVLLGYFSTSGKTGDSKIRK